MFKNLGHECFGMVVVAGLVGGKHYIAQVYPVALCRGQLLPYRFVCGDE